MTLSPHWPGPHQRGHALAGNAGGGGAAATPPPPPTTTATTTGKRMMAMSHHAHRPHDAPTYLANPPKPSLGTKLSYEIRLEGKGVVAGSLYDPLRHEAHSPRALLSAPTASGVVGSSATAHARAPAIGSTTATKRGAHSHSPARQEHQLPGKRNRVVAAAAHGRSTTRAVTTAGSAPSTGAVKLPHLLSHMSLSDKFALASSEAVRVAFENAHQSPSSPLRSTTRPERTSTKRAPGTTLTSEGKRSAEDCVHLTMRCKKMKLSHAFYRCGSLFYRCPPTSAISSAPTSTPPPPAEPASAPTSMASPRKYIPHTTRRLSSWWASVSRHGGDARVSRMCPDEAIWVANAGSEWQGPKWQTLWSQRVKANKHEETSSSDGTSNLDGTSNSNEQSSTISVASKSSSKFSFRSRPSRSVSSPPNWTPPTSHSHTHQSGEHNFPWAPIPLKQHLLAVLRARSAESGGSSRGGDAGLKFKKWVIWNHWSRKGRSERTEAEEGEFDGIDDSDDSDEEDMISPVVHEDAVRGDAVGYEATSCSFDGEKEGMWSDDPTSFFEGENVLDAVLDTTIVPLPIVLSDEPGVTVVDPIILPLLMDDDLVESADAGAESNYTLGSPSLTAPILLQQPHLLSLRPSLRRSHSAPSSILSVSSSSTGSAVLTDDSSLFMFDPSASGGANGVVQLVCVDRKDGATSPPIACEG